MSADVKRLVKQAAEAAKLAPEHLQEAAFNRAFEALLGAKSGDGSVPRQQNAGSGAKTPKKRRQAKDAGQEVSLHECCLRMCAAHSLLA